MDARADNITPPWLEPDVLAGFIDELREAGYKIGISHYIAVQDLILALIAHGETLESPECLRTLLGPILCSSPGEQEDFQQRFDHWAELINHTDRGAEGVYVKAQGLSEELGKIRSRFRRLWILMTAVLVLIGISPIFLRQLRHSSLRPTVSPSPVVSTKPTVSPSPTASTKPTVSPSPIAPTPRARHFRLDRQTILTVLSLTLVITFLFWQLWWRWRAQLFLQRLSASQEPELQKISIRDFERTLFPTILFAHISQGLRRRIRIPSNELDVGKTIDATLRQGGWLSPVYGTYQVLPEYLFLIDRASFRDHQSKFVEEMIGCLERDGVFITRYFFDGDPRICFSDERRNSPQRLDEITVNYHQHCLIVVSDAEKFFSVVNSELEPWVGQLTTWEKRFVLTPKPVENWRYQELELAQQFVVLPATPEGLEVLSQSLHQRVTTYFPSEEPQTPLPEPLRLRPYRWIERDPLVPEQINAMLILLQKYLGKQGFYWLGACAIFPELHWNITLYLGQVLKSEEGCPLLETYSPLSLARLPWFRYGSMPDWFRLCLISTLTPEQERTIRTALQDLLVAAIQGSVGRAQLEVARQHHSFLPKLVNPMLRLLAKRASEGSPLRDYIFLGFMTGQRILATKVPDEFRRLLKRQTRPYQSFRRFGISGLVASLVLTTGAAIAALYLQHSQRQRVEQLALTAEALLPTDPTTAAMAAISAVGLSQSLFVQFPNYPMPVFVRNSLLEVIQGNPQQNQIKTPDPVYSVAFSPDGKTIASGGGDETLDSFDKTMKLWSLDGGLLHTFNGHTSSVYSVSFSPDGKTIASGSGDGTIKLWSRDGQLLHTFDSLFNVSSSVHSVSFSPDGKTIASSVGDTIELWSLDGHLLQTFSAHTSIIHSVSFSSVSFSPDGKTIASGSGDGTIRLWSLVAGRLLRSFNGHESEVLSLSFSLDGKTIVSGSADKTIKLWSLNDDLSQTFNGHEAEVLSVSFSPDGKTIASGSADKTIKLWSLDGRNLHTFTGHTARVTSVSFSPDGKTIASGSADKTIRLWSISWESLLQTACQQLSQNRLLLEPQTNVAKEAKDTCQQYVWSKQ